MQDNRYPPLLGKKCRLQPLTNAHYDALAAIVLSNPENYQFTTLGQTADDFARWFAMAESDAAWVIYNTVENKIVGSTRFYQTDRRVGQTKIGYTWLSPDAIGTGINKEVKYLLLSYAFEQLRFVRVAFDIDSENMRSRRAVEKLGAVFEGELRLHRRRLDGSLGNTCCYSIISDEWLSSVKDRLARHSD